MHQIIQTIFTNLNKVKAEANEFLLKIKTDKLTHEASNVEIAGQVFAIYCPKLNSIECVKLKCLETKTHNYLHCSFKASYLLFCPGICIHSESHVEAYQYD